MAGIITTGSIPQALWPGMHKFWGRTYNEYPVEYSQVFMMDTSNKAYEKDQELTGFGLAPVKPQGDSVIYDSETGGPTTQYNNIAYGLGYIVTREEIDDTLYEEVSMRRIKALAFSMRQTKEVVHAGILNRGFTSGYTGGDGVVFFSTAHPTVNGTQSNTLAIAADLSEASLEDIFIQISLATNSRGLRIALKPTQLIVPPNEWFNATRIVKSDLQNDTANNAINAQKSLGMIPKGIMNYHYLTDTDAWFVATDVPNGLTAFTRTAIEFTRDNDFDSENQKAKAYERYSCGWTDFRTMYASPGA